MANNPGTDLIEEAFEKALNIKFDEYVEGDMLVEWVIVGFVSNLEATTNGYPVLVSNGNMPSHHLRGLLHTALKMCDEAKGED